MAGADTIIKLIGGTLALVIIIFVGAVGYALMDPIYNNVIDPAEMTALGWGAPQNVVMLFAGLGLIGLILVVIVWWIVSPIRDDVRQDVRGGPRF